jgi:hypothetical protein
MAAIESLIRDALSRLDPYEGRYPGGPTECDVIELVSVLADALEEAGLGLYARDLRRTVATYRDCGDGQMLRGELEACARLYGVEFEE